MNQGGDQGDTKMLQETTILKLQCIVTLRHRKRCSEHIWKQVMLRIPLCFALCGSSSQTACTNPFQKAQNVAAEKQAMACDAVVEPHLLADATIWQNP